MSRTRLRFPDETLHVIEAGFDAAYDKARNEGRKALAASDPLVAEERAKFVRAIARSAEQGLRLQNLLARASEKERKRKMASLAKSAATTADTLGKIDDDAMAFLVALIARQTIGKDAAPSFEFIALMRHIRSTVVSDLKLLSEAASRGAKELPVYKINPALTIAMGIERAFIEAGFEFQAGEFANLCLEAAFAAAGIEREDLKHYVSKAKKSEVSMSALIRRLRDSAGRN